MNIKTLWLNFNTRRIICHSKSKQSEWDRYNLTANCERLMFPDFQNNSFPSKKNTIIGTVKTEFCAVSSFISNTLT